MYFLLDYNTTEMYYFFIKITVVNLMGKKYMSNHKIKALIVLNRTSVSEIARRAGVTRQWVSLVVNGHKTSRRIRKAVASAVNKRVEDLWPDASV